MENATYNYHAQAMMVHPFVHPLISIDQLAPVNKSAPVIQSPVKPVLHPANNNEEVMPMPIPHFDKLMPSSAAFDEHEAPTSRPGRKSDKKRVRTAFTKEQMRKLQEIYKECPYITRLERSHLSEKINLPEERIKVWFQNQRMKNKNQKRRNTPNEYYTDNGCRSHCDNRGGSNFQNDTNVMDIVSKDFEQQGGSSSSSVGNNNGCRSNCDNRGGSNFQNDTNVMDIVSKDFEQQGGSSSSSVGNNNGCRSHCDNRGGSNFQNDINVLDIVSKDFEQQGGSSSSSVGNNLSYSANSYYDPYLDRYLGYDLGDTNNSSLSHNNSNSNSSATSSAT